MLTKKQVEVVVCGNNILLEEQEYNSSYIGRSYCKWNGYYKILRSSFPVTEQEVNGLLADGFFGYGQMVNAYVLNDEIHYSGTCDSGD